MYALNLAAGVTDGSPSGSVGRATAAGVEGRTTPGGGAAAAGSGENAALMMAAEMKRPTRHAVLRSMNIVSSQAIVQP
ncbi:MAG: hypothetical protein NVSMB64_18930 [Candidatus Velthaea sp.]